MNPLSLLVFQSHSLILQPHLRDSRSRARSVSASMLIEPAPFVALADAVLLAPDGQSLAPAVLAADAAADPSWFDSCALRL